MAMNHFKQPFGLTSRQFLMIFDEDEDSDDDGDIPGDTRSVIYRYFNNNPHAIRQLNKINEGIFYDLAKAISRDCEIPLLHLAEYMMVQVKKLEQAERLQSGTTSGTHTFERNESTASNQPTEPSSSNQPAEPSFCNQPAEPSSSNQPAEPSFSNQPAEPSSRNQHNQKSE